MNRQKLELAGFDYEDGVKRFLGNEQIYFKFVKRFIDDKAFANLTEALSEKKYEEAFKVAHMLKGTCGNLAMKKLYESMIPLVEALRNSIYDNLDELYQQVKIDYEHVIETISG